MSLTSASVLAAIEDDRRADEAVKERLKAAMHLTVGQLADAQGDKKGVQYTKRFVAALAEVAMLQAEAIARDIEAFAKHNKRTTVNEDDVKLCARRNESVGSALERASTRNKIAKKAAAQASAAAAIAADSGSDNNDTDDNQPTGSGSKKRKTT